MLVEQARYSLWLRPKGEEATFLQSIINKLAIAYNQPAFTPHVTLVGGIRTDSVGVEREKQKIDELADKIAEFSVTLTQYGFMDEEYRSLYLLAQSTELDQVFNHASSIFPQVNNEHFQKLPHLSLLYGDYKPETKQEIIRDNPLQPITFQVQSLDLYITEGSVNTWHEVYTANLSPPG